MIDFEIPPVAFIPERIRMNEQQALDGERRIIQALEITECKNGAGECEILTRPQPGMRRPESFGNLLIRV